MQGQCMLHDSRGTAGRQAQSILPMAVKHFSKNSKTIIMIHLGLHPFKFAGA
jgi:hypothetical protein